MLGQRWGWTLDSKSEAKNSEEAFASYQGAKKQGQLMGQSDMGVHDDNTVDSTDYKLFHLPPPPPEGVSKWEYVMGWAKRNIRQVTHDMHGKRQNIEPHTNKDWTPYSVFMLYFHSCFLHGWSMKPIHYHQ
jgi:hypothetical protein